MRLGLYELTLIASILFIIAVVAYLIFRDARKRGISDFASFVFVLLVIFMFPLGLILYLAYALGKRAGRSDSQKLEAGGKENQ